MRILISSLIAIILLSCNNSKKESLETNSYTNDLIHESSPYLLQHAHNPVNWKAWNEESLKQAKEEKKLLVISIGYAACHWCHVMEHESFEDSTVAAVMNKHFVNIKVDREERPDVDQTYINAVQLMTGSAGWPLNVVALPDGRPIWGGTYFKKQDWINALQQIQHLYREEPEKLIAYANRLEGGLNSLNLITLNTEDLDFKKFPTKKVLSNWAESFDHTWGGYKGAPKFMMPDNYIYLIRYAAQEEDKDLLTYVELSLDKMAYGGIYDHIGGGFARYSVDEKWHIPHFEKMLYDNAQLVSLYSAAYQITENPHYKEIVEESLSFIHREMTNAEGGFYSSLDADSKNKEGKLEEGAFYVYSLEELQHLLAEDFEIFKEYYNVNSFGRWEEKKYVLIRSKSEEEILKKFNLSAEKLFNKKQKWKKDLYQYRKKREKPRLDDKSLTSWNAMMLKAYVEAYKVFQKEDYLNSALKNASFISEKQLNKDGSLSHTYKDGKSSINGFLEDYAFTIDAFISLYQVTLDDKWLSLAKELAEYAIHNFFDEEKHMFYFTSKEDSPIVTRNIEYQDNVIPSSNAVMAQNLFLLSKYFDEKSFEDIPHQMLKNVSEEMIKFPRSFSHWMGLVANYQNDFYEVVVVGKDALKITRQLNMNYIPNKIIAGSKVDNINNPLFENRYVKDETLIYVCINKSCRLPTNSIDTAIKTIIKNK